MRQNRRGFLQTTAALGSYLALRAQDAGAGAPAKAPAARKLTLLFLGGTGFLGPHTVRRAIERGHTVTLFNRGRTNPGLFPDIETLIGDRKGELQALEGRKWDAVIDTSAYVPSHVRLSAELLRDAVSHYTLVSTVSVYRDMAQVGVDETYPVGKLADESNETVDGATYGPLKALCEEVAEECMPGRVARVRPGLIVGDGDSSDRFTYWPARISAGGEVLAPGTAEDLTEFIDVRDLAAWLVHVAEERHTGVFNAVGPNVEHTRMGEVLDACVKASKSAARLTWVDAQFLAENGVSAWSDMPAWIPRAGDYAGFGTVRSDRARAKGLVFRSVLDTVEDTLRWHRTRPPDYRLQAGISREREAEVLESFKKRERQG